MNNQLWKLAPWGGMDIKDSPSLGLLFKRKPQLASELMINIFAANQGKNLEQFLSQFPTKTFEDDSEFYWELRGSSRRLIPLQFAVDEFGTVVTADRSTNVGIGNAPFFLYFEEEYFFRGEFIFGNYDIYKMRILGDGMKEGAYIKYRVEMANGSTEGCPAERLLAGEKFSVEAAYVARDLSRKVGDIRHASTTAMRNEFSTIRKQHKVGGALINDRLQVPIKVKGEDGKDHVFTAYMQNVDWEFEKEFAQEKNLAMLIGRSNKTKNDEYLNVDESGLVIKNGNGLYAQTEVANTIYYNTFSLKMIENALMELCTNKLDYQQRTFVLKTGQRGAYEFCKAVENALSGWRTPFTFNADALGIVSRVNSPIHDNALSAGYQFVEYKAPNGVVLKLDVDPYYDDEYIHKIPHWKGGPAFSYRYDIFDIGSPQEKNIFKCAVKNRPDRKGYQCGPFHNPFTGETDINAASYDEDSAVIHKISTFGVCVLDPTRCMSIVPAELDYN